MSLISIIIPTYKPEDYLLDCLESLDKQDIDNFSFNVFLVLNGSDLTYKDKLEIWIKRYSFNCQLIFIQESGVSNARNTALDLIQDGFVCFLDDDDIISSNYISSLLEVSSKNNIGVSNVLTFKNEVSLTEPYFMTFKAPFKCDIGIHHREVYSTIWAKMIHRRIIADLRFSKKFNIGEDSLFMFSLTKNFTSIRSTSIDCIYYRRIRDNSAISKRNSMIFYILNLFKNWLTYSFIYFKNPFRYNLILYINRIAACFKSFILFCFSKHK